MTDTLTTQTLQPSTIPNNTVIATDDAGASGHVQIIKLAVSTDGSATLIPADSNGLSVHVGPGDIISNVPVFMDFDQHQIHEGETWHWDVYISNLGSGSSHDIVFIVANITIPAGVEVAARCPHLRYDVNANDLANYFLYEAPTVTAATGTPGTPINLERNGSYTSNVSILDGPTITATGTQIDAEYFLSASTNQNNASNSASSVDEFVLKNDTQYLFRVTSGADGCDIHIDFRWYEDTGE